MILIQCPEFNSSCWKVRLKNSSMQVFPHCPQTFLNSSFYFRRHEYILSTGRILLGVWGPKVTRPKGYIHLDSVLCAMQLKALNWWEVWNVSKERQSSSFWLSERVSSLAVCFKMAISSNTPTPLGHLFKALQCVPCRGQSLSLMFTSYRQQIPKESRLSTEWIFLQSAWDLSLF